MFSFKETHFLLLAYSILLFPVLSYAGFNPGAAPWVGSALSGEPCQSSEGQGFGPFDYTDPTARKMHLPIVEEYHFTQEIQSLIKGKTGYLVDDLNYTLNSFPNHHRALIAIGYYQVLNVLEINKGAKERLRAPVECYFQRAINFSPNDFVVYGLYAHYLKKANHADHADAFFKRAIKHYPDKPELKYVYGLFLFDSKKYHEALQQAEEIYKKSNYPKQKLKQKLMASGHWKEK